MNMILDWEYKCQCLEICINGLEIIYVLYENLNKKKGKEMNGKNPNKKGKKN